jgi:hypothetical protein
VFSAANLSSRLQEREANRDLLTNLQEFVPSRLDCGCDERSADVPFAEELLVLGGRSRPTPLGAAAGQQTRQTCFAGGLGSSGSGRMRHLLVLKTRVGHIQFEVPQI